MKVVDQCEAATRQIDYRKLAESYNGMEIGKSVEMARVYNITTFKAALLRRGLKQADFRAFNRQNFCYVTKMTDTQMLVI